MAFVTGYLRAFFSLFVEMAPYLLLGFLFAGILHAFFRSDTLSRHLGKRGFVSSLKAALLGVPLPLCSCGVIPTGLSLNKHGASKGATVSFLIATPQTGLDSIFATSALMGWPMAVIRPLAAFVTGVVGGSLTDKLLKPDAPAVSGAPSVADSAVPASESGNASPGLAAKVRNALHYGFVEMLSGIAKWLLMGLAVAALISMVVPDEFFARYLSNYWLSVLLILMVAVPLYVCATGSIPVALALMMKGMSPGVAFVFLMAGPATMASTIAVVGKSLGRKTLVIYLASIVGGAVLFGYLIDSVLPAQWFMPALAHAHHSHEGLLPLWFQYVNAILLASLIGYSFLRGRGLFSRRKKVAADSGITNTYKVDTITCSNCKMHLEEAVGVLPGVDKVIAHVKSSTLTVAGPVDVAVVRAAVAKAGYRLES